MAALILNWFRPCFLRSLHSICSVGLLFFGVSFALFPRYVRFYFCDLELLLALQSHAEGEACDCSCFMADDIQSLILIHWVVKSKWIIYGNDLEECLPSTELKSYMLLSSFSSPFSYKEHHQYIYTCMYSTHLWNVCTYTYISNFEIIAYISLPFPFSPPNSHIWLSLLSFKFIP